MVSDRRRYLKRAVFHWSTYACSLSSTHVETSPTTFMKFMKKALESSELGADSGAADCAGVDISTSRRADRMGGPSDVEIVRTWDGMLLARRDGEGGHQRGHRDRHTIGFGVCPARGPLSQPAPRPGRHVVVRAHSLS